MWISLRPTKEKKLKGSARLLNVVVLLQQTAALYMAKEADTGTADLAASVCCLIWWRVGVVFCRRTFPQLQLSVSPHYL